MQELVTCHGRFITRHKIPSLSSLSLLVFPHQLTADYTIHNITCTDNPYTKDIVFNLYPQWKKGPAKVSTWKDGECLDKFTWNYDHLELESYPIQHVLKFSSLGEVESLSIHLGILDSSSAKAKFEMVNGEIVEMDCLIGLVEEE